MSQETFDVHVYGAQVMMRADIEAHRDQPRGIAVIRQGDGLEPRIVGHDAIPERLVAEFPHEAAFAAWQAAGWPMPKGMR